MDENKKSVEEKATTKEEALEYVHQNQYRMPASLKMKNGYFLFPNRHLLQKFDQSII
ncbi:MAG: hypothetical protein GXZ02_05145 [Clostridiales bacterium]|nr:hypothetical protein [Clostridiales bacterium]